MKEWKTWGTKASLAPSERNGLKFEDSSQLVRPASSAGTRTGERRVDLQVCRTRWGGGNSSGAPLQSNEPLGLRLPSRNVEKIGDLCVSCSGSSASKETHTKLGVTPSLRGGGGGELSSSRAQVILRGSDPFRLTLGDDFHPFSKAFEDRSAVLKLARCHLPSRNCSESRLPSYHASLSACAGYFSQALCQSQSRIGKRRAGRQAACKWSGGFGT